MPCGLTIGLDSLGQAQVVAGVNLEIAVLIGQAERDGEVHALHAAVDAGRLEGFFQAHLYRGAGSRDLDLVIHLEAWLDTCLQGQSLDDVEIQKNWHVDVVHLNGSVHAIDIILYALLRIEGAKGQRKKIGRLVFELGAADKTNTGVTAFGIGHGRHVDADFRLDVERTFIMLGKGSHRGQQHASYENKFLPVENQLFKQCYKSA